jgi:hypothetical protein
MRKSDPCRKRTCIQEITDPAFVQEEISQNGNG